MHARHLPDPAITGCSSLESIARHAGERCLRGRTVVVSATPRRSSGGEERSCRQRRQESGFVAFVLQWVLAQDSPPGRHSTAWLHARLATFAEPMSNKADWPVRHGLQPRVYTATPDPTTHRVTTLQAFAPLRFTFGGTAEPPPAPAFNSPWVQELRPGRAILDAHLDPPCSSSQQGSGRGAGPLLLPSSGS